MNVGQQQRLDGCAAACRASCLDRADMAQQFMLAVACRSGNVEASCSYGKAPWTTNCLNAAYKEILC